MSGASPAWIRRAASRLLGISIAGKMMVAVGLVGLLFAGTLMLFYLPAFERELMKDRKEGLKNLVEVVHSLLGDYHGRVMAGELTQEEAQKRALERIDRMRYGNGDYFWINDTTMPLPWMLMHPIIAGLKGGELDQERFQTGSRMQYGVGGRIEDIPGADKNILQAFVEVVNESGEGYVTYAWPKPTEAGGTEKYYPKESYVKLFAPWGWVVGTGAYIDDIQTRLARMRWAIVAASGATLAAGLTALAALLGAFVTRPISALTEYAERVSAGERHAEVGGEFHAEAARLKSSILRMVADLEEALRQAEARQAEARKEAEKSRQLTEKLDAVFTSMQELAVRHELAFDGDGNAIDYRIVECNRAFERAVGMGRDAICGRLASEFYGTTPPPHLDEYARVALGGGAASFETRGAPRADRHYIVSAASPGPNEFVTIATDITERKLAEEALRHVRQYLSNVIDSMPSILVGVDEDGKVTQWNVQAQRATGLAAKDAEGMPLEQAFPRLAEEMARVRQAMGTRETQTRARKARQEAGETRFEDVTVYPLVANGAKGAVIRVDDVTEHVRIEEMMLQSEKMLSVGGLAAGMAHEINNPLGGMVQTASVMGSRLSNAALPANRRAAEEAGTTMEAIEAFMRARGIFRMLDNIRTSGGRAAEIVSNMLHFARKDDAERQEHDLAELMDRCVDLAGSDYDLKKKYDFRQVEIAREYEEGVPPAPCLPGKIQQVLLNVLRNAAEAMQEEKAAGKGGGKKPRIALRLAHEKAAKRARIEIEDNGPGMDEATRKRVFEPFFTTKPTDRGTGLGLSVSYFIVTENHGGEMWAEAEKGRGTKMVIRLPLERSEG